MPMMFLFLQESITYKVWCTDQINLVKDLAHPSVDSTEFWPEWMDTEGLDAEGAENNNEILVLILSIPY